MNNKKFGVLLILGLLVLSMSFTSAGWFSDTWNKITGKAITGNVVADGWVYQENADSFSAGTGGQSFWMYVTYNKPSGATSKSVWLVKHGSLAPYNITIPEDCWNAYPDKIQFALMGNSNDGASRAWSQLACYSGSGNLGWPYSNPAISGWKTIGNYQTEVFGGSGSGSSSNSINNIVDGDWNTYSVWTSWSSPSFWHTSHTKAEPRLYEEAMYWNIGDENNCVPTIWTPSADDFCSTDIVNQTSNCGTTRIIYGAKNCSVQPNVTCIDSDGGLNYYEKGTTSGIWSFWQRPDTSDDVVTIQDECSNNGVREQYCDFSEYSDGRMDYNIYACSACSDGACINSSQTTCTDSDGGMNVYVKGVAGGWSDACVSDNIDEGACVNNTLVINSFICPNGCVDGACVNGSYLILNNIPPFIFEDQMIEDHVEVSIYNAEYKYSESLGENLVSVFVGKTPGWREIFEEEILEESLNNNYTYEKTPKGVVITRQNINGRDFFVWVSDGLGVVVNQHSEIALDDLVEAYLNKYPSTLTSPQESCDSFLSTIKNPTDFTDNSGNLWKTYKNYLENGSEVPYAEVYNGTAWIDGVDEPFVSYHSGHYNYTSSHGKWLSYEVLVFDNSNVNLSKFMLHNLFSYDSCGAYSYNGKIVYLCRDSSSGNSYGGTPNLNQGERISAIWFKDNVAFKVGASEQGEVSYDELNAVILSKMEYEMEMGQQELSNFLDLLKNNRFTDEEDGYRYWGRYVDWRNISADFIDGILYSVFSNDCESDLTYELIEKDSFNHYRYCRVDPAICPPHGEQKEICEYWNEENQNYEFRESTRMCNPGICSGCTVPKWFESLYGFESLYDTKCIPYMARFLQKGQDVDQVRLEYGLENSHVVNYLGTDRAQIIFFGEFENVSYDLFEGERMVWNMPEGWKGSDEPSFDVLIEGIDDEGVLVKFFELRQFNAYCDIDGQIKQQQGDSAECQNNYECFSNECRSGFCVDTYAAVGDQGSILLKIWCKLSTLFGTEDDYQQCILVGMGYGD